ncbi:MAG: tripartite tricarboxylate transporter TctB family protein [Thermodesulfobacteriota bacterium]
MKRGLIAVSIALMVASVVGMIESSKLPRSLKMGIGIGFLPFWMSAAIGILALLLFISTFRGRMALEDKPIFVKESLSLVIPVFIAMILYLILINIVGYGISTFLFLFATILVLQRSRWVTAFISAVVFTFFLYALFKLFLRAPLPTGLIGV